jgi:hypothetical protein
MSLELTGPEPYELLVPASELGPEWVVDSSKQPGRPDAMTPSYAASYIDPAAGREAHFVLLLESEAARADAQVNLVAAPPDVASRRIFDLGDGAALRCATSRGAQTMVAYVFRVGRIAAHAFARGAVGSEAELDAQALHHARLQDARLRAMSRDVADRFFAEPKRQFPERPVPTGLRERYRKVVHTSHQTIALLDAKNSRAFNFDPWPNEMWNPYPPNRFAFGPSTVMVLAPGDEDIEVSVYEGEAEPDGDLEHRATGMMVVGERGLEIGALPSCNGRIDWPKGEVAVGVYSDHSGEDMTRVAFILSEPGTPSAGG